MVVFSLQFLQEFESPVAVLFLASVPSVGKEDGNDGVDDEQVERERRYVLLVAYALASEGVMRLPVGRNRCFQHSDDLLHGGGFEQMAETCLASEIEVGQLGDADVGEVLRAQSQKAPELVVYGREREFMLQIEVFIPEFGEISVVQCVFLIAFGDG